MSESGIQKRPSPGPARGTLSVPEGGTLQHERIAPCAALEPHVAHFWWVKWDLNGEYLAQTLPHPCVHVTFETPARSAEVVGVCSQRFDKRLTDAGHVLGVKFRPTAFHAICQSPLADFADCRLPVSDWFSGHSEAAHGAWDASQPQDAIPAVEAWLCTALAPLSPRERALRDLVERTEHDRTWTRVEQMAEHAHVSVRTLQRWFREYVGLSPKHVLRRYRLIEAAEQLKSGEYTSLTDVAVSLDYFDQSHFVRDFKEVVGVPPGEFVTAASGHSS